MIRSFKNFVWKIDRWACMLGNICIVVNMLVVVFNIIMRNLFNASLASITDYAGFISCLIVVFSLGFTESQNGNPKVDFIVGYLPVPIQKGIYLLMAFLDIVVGGMLTISFFSYAASSAAAGTTSMNASLPYTPFLIVCALGMLLFVLTVLAKTAAKLTNWKEGE